MSSNITLKQAAEFFASNDAFTVFTHANPDGDTIGSAVALVRILRSLGKRAVAVCADKLPHKLSFMDADGIFVKEIPADTQTFVSVDVASKSVLGKLGSFCDCKEFDLSIDHHKINTLPSKRLLVKDNYIANGEIIYELALEMGAKLDAKSASALYAAICSDSGGFKYANTRAETYEYAAHLIRGGADFVTINKLLFEQKTKRQIDLERVAYNSLEFYCGGKFALVKICEDTAKELCLEDSDYDVVNQIPRQIMGVEVSAVLRPRDNGTKVSLRSNDYFDVAEFAAKYGGGGHTHAAGYRYNGAVSDAAAVLIKDMDRCF